MFKNEINFTQSHPLSKKEKKEIFKSLSSNYDDEYIKYIISNFNELSIQKGSIQNKKRNVIFNGNNPILFEIDKEKYIPTVYLLEYFNLGLGINIIKNVCIIYDSTASYIINGADLMLKGILNRNLIKNSENNFSFDEIFYVQTITGKIIAIGSTLVDKNLMNIEQPSGKFLKIIQRIEDSLWNIGCKKEINHVDLPVKINNNLQILFEKKNKKNIIEDNEDLKNDNESENKENNSLKNNEEKEEKKIEDKKKEDKDLEEINTNKNEEKEDEKIDDKNIDDINLNKNEEKEQEINSNEEIENNEEEEDKKIELPSEEEIDEHLNIVFLTLCKLHLQEEQFPIDPGKLYNSFMKPLSSELKLFIDIKLSSYKKVNEYFKYLSKEKKYLTFSKAKGQNNLYIQSINFDNEEIKSFKPRIKKIKFLSHQNDNKEEDNILLSKDEKIEIVSYYKPQPKIHPLFNKYLVNFSTKEYYPMKQCKEVLISYLKEHNLFITGTNSVKLDSDLEKMLNVHYTTFSIEDREYTMDELLEMWKNNLIEKNFVIKTNISENKSEAFMKKNLQIRIISKKIHNKNVTLISGLENFIDNIEVVCKSLAKYFATSVTIKDEISGLKNAVFIQGHWVDELVEKLINEFKINKKIIKIEDRLKNKKKK